MSRRETRLTALFHLARRAAKASRREIVSRETFWAAANSRGPKAGFCETGFLGLGAKPGQAVLRD